MYQNKQPGYYSHVRLEIVDLLPAGIDRLLDVGCGDGSTGYYLKTNGFCASVTGIEHFPEAAAIARNRLDEVLEENIETGHLDLPESSFDALLCLDVLEHLIDPWAALSRLTKFVRPGGTLVVSVPNVRSLKVLAPLVFLGKWKYQDIGILDRTHLRFFTRISAIELVSSSGWNVVRVKPLCGRYLRFLNTVSMRLFSNFLATQYLIIGRRGK